MAWLALLMSCAEGPPGPRGADEQARVAEPVAESLVARVEGTEGHEDIEGVIRMQPMPGGGLHVVAEVSGLAPGRHALYVHALGDCASDDATSGGIIGELGELDADEQGIARLRTVVEDASTAGPQSVVGRSIVILERGNDISGSPDGDAGARVACGVIGIAGDAS